jgi:hypothetical protein
MRRSYLALIGMAVLATLAPVVAPVTAQAATASTLVGDGSWSNPLGADSSCSSISSTTVSCSHSADSARNFTETCLETANVAPGVNVDITCHASLTATSSGPGVRASEGFAPQCETLGISTGVLSFSDAVHGPYPSVPVTIVNNGGAATYFGALVNADGALIAKASGSFTLACGAPISVAGLHGAFSGSYSLAG